MQFSRKRKKTRQSENGNPLLVYPKPLQAPSTGKAVCLKVNEG